MNRAVRLCRLPLWLLRRRRGPSIYIPHHIFKPEEIPRPSSMESPPSPSLILLDRRVNTYPPGYDTANIQGHILTSGAKLAVGFGEDDEADSVVRRLELKAELAGETDLSFVTLRGGNQYSCINTVDKNLILIASAFLEIYPFDVLLIYDAIDGSLRMIPYMPHTYSPVSTALALVARPHEDDGDKSYALVFPGTDGDQDVLFLALPTSTSSSPWEKKKKANFPEHPHPDNSLFKAEQVFSFHGRGYWVNLLRGVLYCDCSEVLSDDVDCVDIRSLDLPLGCMKYLGNREDIAEAKAFRTMGPVGDSIKFVSIDGYLEHVDLKDCKVRVWTLMADMNWAVEYELKLASLWAGGDFKGDSVPQEMAPMYPFLSTHEDNVIYFALGSLIRGEKNCFPTQPCRMLCIDLHSKTIKSTRLSESQRNCMTSHLALSRDAAEKLLRGRSLGRGRKHRKSIRNPEI